VVVVVVLVVVVVVVGIVYAKEMIVVVAGKCRKILCAIIITIFSARALSSAFLRSPSLSTLIPFFSISVSSSPKGARYCS